MIGELLHFAVVVAIIMMGFTVGFYAIFSEHETYGEVWIDVFRAMLGDTAVFDP